MRVEVYRNLRKRCWSIRHKGKVIAHEDGLVVWDCELVSQPAGRERVRREKRKNVHAFIRGEWYGPKSSTEDITGYKITYNPYTDDTFMCEGNSIEWAYMVTLTKEGAFL